MIRRPLLFVPLIAAALTLPAPAVSAVTIENPGTHTITGENTLAIHAYIPGSMTSNPIELTGLKCSITSEASSGADGSLALYNISFTPHTGSIGNCGQWNDCDDLGWGGQIEEGHVGTYWEYAFHYGFCMENMSPHFDGIWFFIECRLASNGASYHCGGTHDGEGPDVAEGESHLLVNDVAPGVSVEYAVEGEMFISPAIQLMHE